MVLGTGSLLQGKRRQRACDQAWCLKGSFREGPSSIRKIGCSGRGTDTHRQVCVLESCHILGAEKADSSVSSFKRNGSKT